MKATVISTLNNIHISSNTMDSIPLNPFSCSLWMSPSSFIINFYVTTGKFHLVCKYTIISILTLFEYRYILRNFIELNLTFLFLTIFIPIFLDTSSTFVVFTTYHTWFKASCIHTYLHKYVFLIVIQCIYLN